MKSIEELKREIIVAGHAAVEQLIIVAKEDIIKSGDDTDLAADRLKNAAAAKKMAIFDAFEILTRIEAEEDTLNLINSSNDKIDTKQGFAERRSAGK
jgi:ASC-1-like (ASCH) protein